MKICSDYFGGCPECGDNDGYANAGKAHIFYCKEHKTQWVAGANLFSSCRGETEEEQRKKYNEIGLDTFREVKPLQEGTPIFGQGSLANAVVNETIGYAGQIISTALKKVLAATTSELEEISHHIATVNGYGDIDPAKDEVALMLFRAVDAEIRRRRSEPFRNRLHERIVDTVAESINGSPWADCVENALSKFKVDVDRLISADPELKEIFDRKGRVLPPSPEDFGVPF